FQAEDGIRDKLVTGVQTCALPICVAVFDLGSLTVTQTIPVDAARMAYLSGSTLYVVGTPPTAPANSCANQTTAATICGRLDIVRSEERRVGKEGRARGAP